MDEVRNPTQHLSGMCVLKNMRNLVFLFATAALVYGQAAQAQAQSPEAQSPVRQSGVAQSSVQPAEANTSAANPTSVPPQKSKTGITAIPDSATAAESGSPGSGDPGVAMPSRPGPLSAEQIRDLIQRAAANDIENDKKQRNYTFIERDVENNLDSNGRTKSTEIKTYEVLNIYGEQVQKLIEKDDKPISAKDAAKEDEKIQKIIRKRSNESDKDREKRAEKEAKEREEGKQFEREVADAYNFTLQGTELVSGRDAWVISAEPRPGFVPHMKYANYLSKFRGRVWIDKADVQMSKMEIEALDTVSWGLFLARFHKGSHFMIEQTRINDEVWLPRELAFKVDLRLALLKNFRVEAEQTFRDYKKFRTDSKIIGVSEMQK